MNPATIQLLNSLGFECDGVDPEALSHHRYYDPKTRICISVPSAGCSAADIVRIIYHAGARAARKEIAGKFKDLTDALKFPT